MTQNYNAHPSHLPVLSKNATERQVLAADATASVWVDASAGTGKTKVLVDRVLRLLLPRMDGQPATAPNRLLCLTYTNAAAAEMVERIQEVSKSWLTLDHSALVITLQALFGQHPTEQQVNAARQLFATIVDTPGGLKVTTLHAFSQSILRRFPIEAGLSPALQLADEGQSTALLEQARNAVFRLADKGDDTAGHARCQRLLHITNAQNLTKTLANTLKERRWLHSFFAAHPTEESIVSALYTGWKIAAPPDTADFWASLHKNRSFLRKIYDALTRHGGKRPMNLAEKINLILSCDDADWDHHRALYIAAFLTDKGTISKHHIEDVTKADPALIDTYMHVAETLQSMQEADNIRDMAHATTDLLIISYAVLQQYQHIKIQKNILDFDDQILTTRTLLESQAAWVMYKLDQGIDHILVDEAQDTNPDQWGIITALAMEFFAGKSARSDTLRTLFTVGDEKQAIYGFQRANPDDFGRTRKTFEVVLQQNGQPLHQIPLDTSFRSGPAVLHFVDRVMNQPEVRDGLISTAGGISHTAHRQNAGGRVSLWPVFVDTPQITETPLHLSINSVQQSGSKQLVSHITTTIRDWLDTQRPLVAKGRPVRPGDILILLRKRGTLQTMLVRALRQAGIPVSGLDRMNLTDTMVAQDMFHLAKLALQPADDYTLAGLLKSPFIGMDETALYSLTTTKHPHETLWARLCRAPEMAETVTWLQNCMARATRQTAYDFFATLLHSPCPQGRSGYYALQHRLGHDITEIVNALLDHALALQPTTPDILGFITSCRAAPPTIKRQLSPGQDDSVTVMTIHAAKGLQAPIVILADARGSRQKNDLGFIWPHEGGMDMPLWTTKGGKSAPAMQAKDTKKKREGAESRRLLYVALTRAEDEIYITGYSSKEPTIEPTDWYSYSSAAMKNIAQEPPPAPFALLTNTENTLTLSYPQIGEPEVKKAKKDVPAPVIQSAGWLDQAVAAESLSLPLVLQPSQMEAIQNPAAMSPLAGQRQHRFARGIHTHTLLQHLPDCPAATRTQVAADYLKRYAHDLPTDLHQQIVGEVMALLTNPALTYLFGPEAQAEVPISGQLPDGRWINGQIDRLLVTDTHILVLDYKTNRPPPKNVADVSPSYRRQMATYRALLTQIYPGRPVTAYLLWTDGPVLMEIPDE